MTGHLHPKKKEGLLRIKAVKDRKYITLRRGRKETKRESYNEELRTK